MGDVESLFVFLAGVRMKEIKYLGYYDTGENARQDRGYAVSAADKMSYICSVLNRAGWDVEIVSASNTQKRENYPGKRVRVLEGTWLRLFATIGRGGTVRGALRIMVMQLQVFLYLFCHTRRGEPVLAYHALGYARLLRVLKKLKGFRLILEVEEIYADVIGDERVRKREMKLFEAADAYIFSTELLDKRLNPRHKPSSIVHGDYRVGPDREKSGDGKIHCVYAGTFDPRKGVGRAVEAAAFLPPHYHVHILGAGSVEEEKRLREQIEAVARQGGASVTWEGLLHGEAYLSLIQRCQVGLSPQMPDAAFSGTSFPSKVLSYLANGLRVVSIRMGTLECSAISDLLYYYDTDAPQALAKAVREVDVSAPYDSRTRVRELDERFCRDLKDLLKELTRYDRTTAKESFGAAGREG